MSLRFRLVNGAFRRLLRILCRVDDEHWDRIPASGPLLVAANHVNFLEVPLMYTHLLPRPLAGFAKAENWENPYLRWVFDLWGAIPLHRGEADTSAIRAALAALEQGRILAMAPEGTRTGTGVLRRGHPGIVLLALRSGAPLLPAAYFGHEAFWDNLRRLRRTDFQLRVGSPFRLDPGGARVTRAMRQAMADEIMIQIARLLPERYRGVYADRVDEALVYSRRLTVDGLGAPPSL